MKNQDGNGRGFGAFSMAGLALALLLSAVAGCGGEADSALPDCDTVTTAQNCTVTPGNDNVSEYVTCQHLADPVVGCMMTLTAKPGVVYMAECVASCPAQP